VTIDVNVSLFRYPTRRFPHDAEASLTAFLQSSNVTQAWAGSYEGLLHRDIAGVNERLRDACGRSDGLLIPFGTIDPTLPDWEDDVRRCHEIWQMPGIRLFPNYHGYALDDPQFERLLQLAGERKLIVQIAVKQEDPRTQHRLLSVPDVDVLPLKSLAAKYPGTRIVLLNALMSTSADQQAALAALGNISFDIATLEGVGGITRLMKSVPADRILFGSHAPFFIWQSAELKLKESELPQPVIEQIRHENAAALLEYRL
jgi:predicted TIM-barrel fold metal-dependent hydrolase